MPPEHFLWMYDDPARGLALIRGMGVEEVLRRAGLIDRARYSVAGKGWVITAADVADLAAYADYANISYRIKAVAA